jgi:hypothetical protein
MEEVKRMTKRSKNIKATGYDGTPAKTWKAFFTMKGGNEIVINVFIKVMNGEEFPMDWKVAIIHSIYKGKVNRKEPRNYRGISLLSVLM